MRGLDLSSIQYFGWLHCSSLGVAPAGASGQVAGHLGMSLGEFMNAAG